MRLPWQRKPSWPKHLERRQSANAALRAQYDAEHKASIERTADLAEKQAAETARRIRQVEAAVSVMSARLGLASRE